MAIPTFDLATLQSLCDVLGDTGSGLTGSQIGRLLAECGIQDSDISTKRHRLFDSLSRRQAADRSGNNVAAFIQNVMAPVRWRARTDEWEAMRQNLSDVLAFAALDVDRAGRLVPADKRTSFARPDATPTSSEPAPPSAEELKHHRVRAALPELLDEFMRLEGLPDRQSAGRMLESVLARLFELFDLEPHISIRIDGEQIDGSFVLDGETYLLEAKWTKDKIMEDQLLVFRGKIEGKSSFTRGLFVSVAGFTAGAQTAIVRGKTQTFAMIDGGHLYRVLNGDWELAWLLRRLMRTLGETGNPYMSVADLAGAS